MPAMQVRLTDEEHQAMNAAARLAGISLSAWVRMHLRRAAIHDHREVGLKPPLIGHDTDD